MRDPYFYEDVDILRNKLNIKNQEELDGAEANYVSLRLKELVLKPIPGDYHTKHFLEIHRNIFQDIYEWAGEPRIINIYKEEDVLGGMSIEYSDPFDIISDLRSALKNMREKEWNLAEREETALFFCESLAQIWKVHPFREGNTRTTITFCCQYVDELGFGINRELFEKNARYVRTALVAYNAFFADGTDFAKKEYLERIVKDAFGVRS